MKRRDFVRAMGLGAGATLLSPLLGRLLTEARGEDPSARKNLIILTGGNGWGHQGMSRKGETLDTTVRSPTDWDLPLALAPLAPIADRVTITRPFSAGSGLHGSGWGALSGAGNIGQLPAGVSLDRYIARELGGDDAFPSIALGVAKKEGRRAVSMSADGALKPFPAIASPITAHGNIFGGSGDEAIALLARRKSMLDGVVEDVERARGKLASQERAKFDQILDSYRRMEVQLTRRQEIFSERPVPQGPGGDGKGTFTDATISGHVDVIANTLSFGLSHVAHLSVFGFNDFDPGWGFLGFGGDAHQNIAHVGSGYDKARATEAYTALIDYKAGQLLRLYQALDQVAVGDTTLARNSVFVWLNSAGSKHHNGGNDHPIVLIGDAGGALATGQYLEIGKRPIQDAFLTISQALGVESDTFGDAPEATPVAEWLA